MKSGKNKVLVLGYFGFENNQLDGQTVKTRNIYKMLKSKESSDFQSISYFDTQTFQNSKFNLFKVFKLIAKTDLLFYLPAQNNFKYIFPFIYSFCKLTNTKIHYIVVGGWLATHLKSKPLHKWMLSNINGIYPQTRQLTHDLNVDYGLTNVHQLNNFRMVERPNLKPRSSDLIRLVFMARVHPLKGANTLFKLVEQIKAENIKNVEIDMYGPIYAQYSQDFQSLLANQTIISYKGILQPEEIYSTLINYDLMLFPTQYFTEGFPGSILDAYIAHLPVIATKWKYAEEFIESGNSGVIVDFENEQEFVTETIKLIQNPDLLKQLKRGAMAQSEKYSPEKAWNTIKETL